MYCFPKKEEQKIRCCIFCGKVFENMGYERYFLQHPSDGRIDYESLLKNAAAYFNSLDITEYEKIVFVAKSMGIAVAGAIKERFSIPAEMVFLTPLEETLQYIRKDNDVLFVAMGSNDRYISFETVKQKCEQEGVCIYVEPDIGHRMEIKGNIQRDLEVIQNVVSRLSSCASGEGTKIYHIAGTLDSIGFVCIFTKYQDKWVYCWHKKRQSYEHPGGHVEPGETPLQAAKRELYEETGITDCTMIPLWDYEQIWGDGRGKNNGRMYLAMANSLGELPDSEMDKIELFETVPENYTYSREEEKADLERINQIIESYK